VSCQVGETEGVVGKRGRGVSLFGWGEKVKRWREGIEKVLLAAIDILYSRGGRVGYYRVSGGGGGGFLGVWVRVENGDVDGQNYQSAAPPCTNNNN